MSIAAGLRDDVRHAFRVYRRTPIASSMAVLVLAVAMAFVASFFSLYVDLILRPHPGFEQSRNLITFGWNNGQNAGGLPYELIRRIEEESTTIAAAAGSAPGSFLIGREQDAVVGEMVTRQFFSGVRPRLALGRGFEETDHDAGSEPVAVISHALWLERFGGTPDVLDTLLEVVNRAGPIRVENGRPVTASEAMEYRVVGVMSPRFTGTLPLESAQRTSVWVPAENAIPPPPESESAPPVILRSVMRGIGVRAGNVSPAAIASELQTRFGEDLALAVPLPGVRFDVMPGLVFNVIVHRDTQRQLLLFITASVLLAIVAAANISLFLLARAPGRRREIGIRMSVGATLGRIGRQLASEATLLVAVAATLGILLSIWLAEYLRGMTFLRRAQWRDVALFDWRVLGLIGAFLLVLTVFVSMAPVLGLKRLGIAGSSRQVAARATPAQRIAGTAQIAVAGVLGGAGIAFAWYLATLIFANPGYETRNLTVASYTQPFEVLMRMMSNASETASDPNDAWTAVMVEQARYREAILALPGVDNASLSNIAPGYSIFSTASMPHPDNPNDVVQVTNVKIDDRFVDVLGLQLLHGRAPAEGEAGMLVNRALAQRLFGRDDVAGELLPVPSLAGQTSTPIVGVIDDVSFAHPSADILPTVYSTSGAGSSGLMLIESRLTPARLRQHLESLVQSGALEMTITEVRTFADLRRDLTAADRARGFLTIGTAALVVALAAFGFYGTQRYLVTAGRREYAIRASLGAGPRALGQLVLKRGLLLGLPGLVLGTLLAFITVAWLRGDFVPRTISPVITTAAVAAGLVAILLLASVGPAHHARRTQPAPLLRED